MAQWVCTDAPRTILDPALGGGVFVHAIAEALLFHGKPALRRARMDGIDVDPAMIDSFRAGHAGGLRTSVIQGDFLRGESSAVYDAVIANPPYLRHHDHKIGEMVFQQFDRLCGRRISRLTNTYGLFLLKIWSVLKPGGRAAIITPAEWLNADFGVALKAHLLENNAVDAVIQFSHASKVFSDAMTTAAIILLRRDRDSGETIRVGTVKSARALSPDLFQRLRPIARGRIDPRAKWTPIIERGRTPRNTDSTNGGLKLGDIARCVRGIATGANRFFTLRESERRQLGIDRRDLSVCVTKAQQVRGQTVSAKLIESLLANDQPIWLLNPRKTLGGAIKKYLALGMERGVHERYLPAHRPVWYRPEARRPAPIWVSVFARGEFRFVRNEAGALHLTAFHAIYPRDNNPALIEALFAHLNGSAAQRALRDHRRIYGEGLLKVEPRDVEAMPLPSSFRRFAS